MTKTINNQIQGSQTILTLIIIFCFISFLGQTHYIKKLIRPVEKITGYTNQSQQFFIPFKKCFKIVPQLQANQQLMTFKPSSLQLVKQTQYPIAQNHNFSLLQSLRSPLTYKHKAMVTLQNNLIMVYSVPNKILIIKQQSNQFKVLDQYRIDQMKNLSTPFKLYKFSQSRSIMIIQNHKFFYILDNKGYQKYSLPLDVTFAHLENLEGDDVLIAEFNKGLGHYRLNHTTQSIDLIKRYTKTDLNLAQTYIVDVNTNYLKNGQIYLLDAKAGLIKVTYHPQTKSISTPQIIVPQSSCQAFDSVQPDYFVLLCQLQGYSSIIQIHRKQVNNKTTYQRLQPQYYSTFFTDIEVSNRFFMIFSNKVIDVFWNTVKNRLPETLDTQSQISIPGLETFKLKKISGNNGVDKMFLYSIESGKLVKYLVEESPPKLTFRADKPIAKNMSVYIYGSCQQIGENDIQPGTDINDGKILTCQIKQQLSLNFQDQFYGKSDDWSISASIVILLIMIFLVVIWICLKKYMGLEKEARKVLQVYKRKKGNQARAI